MDDRIDVFYSMQSDYCYFLLNRLISLAGQGIEVVIRPVLGALRVSLNATRIVTSWNCTISKPTPGGRRIIWACLTPIPSHRP